MNVKWLVLLSFVFTVLAVAAAAARFAAGDVAAGAFGSTVAVCAFVGAVCSWRIGRLFDDG